MNFKILLDYLIQLNNNNSREWFEKNRSEFESLKNDFQNLVSEIILKLGKTDPKIADIESKKAIFRINRDVRFSKDKRPYKSNFSAFIKPGGKKSPFAGYYLHIEPGKSFLAGGVYLPEPDLLKNIREAIDYEPETLQSIIKHKLFKKYFNQIEGDQLKNPPKGFDKEHPNLDLLKFKSYTIVYKLSDEEVCDAAFLKKSVQVFSAMLPFNEFLNKAISHTD